MYSGWNLIDWNLRIFLGRLEKSSNIVRPPEEYVLTEYLGAGAFGEVYRVENKEHELIAAAKLLPLMGKSDSALKQALLNEATLATQVSHPNVVNVFHAGDNIEVGSYVLMEYVSGQTLEEFLRTKAQTGSMITLGKAIEMMLHIAQGARAINEKLVRCLNFYLTAYSIFIVLDHMSLQKL